MTRDSANRRPLTPEAMGEYWDQYFSAKGMPWGSEPSDSAIDACARFLRQDFKNILVPGVGYGRNAKVFTERGMNVTGIEVSAKAAELARQYLGNGPVIHVGSVADMPFDDAAYDGIYCYALIHLLDGPARRRFIASCHEQLRAGGEMIFVALSKRSPMFGNGRLLEKDRWLMDNGLPVFFYDRDSALSEFHGYGTIEIDDLEEPIKFMDGAAPLHCIRIRCDKEQ